jgi:hypothetical protein
MMWPWSCCRPYNGFDASKNTCQAILICWSRNTNGAITKMRHENRSDLTSRTNYGDLIQQVSLGYGFGGI